MLSKQGNLLNKGPRTTDIFGVRGPFRLFNQISIKHYANNTTRVAH